MKRAIILAVCLLTLSSFLLIYKVIVLRYSLTREPSSPLWRVCFQMQFKGEGEKAKIGLLLPQSSLRQRIYDERIKRNGFQFHIKEVESGDNRRGWWEKKRLKGNGVLGYEFSVKVKEFVNLKEGDAEEREEWLKSAKEKVKGITVRNLAQQITEGIRDEEEKADALYRYVKDNIKGFSKEKARLLCALLQTIGIPSRIVGGLILEEGIKKNIHFWVEVLLKNSWLPFCPFNGYAKEIPASYLVLYRGDLPLIKKKGIKNLEYLIMAQREKRKQIEFISRLEKEDVSGNRWWSLSSLPLQAQRQVRLLLVIPLGALVVAIFRNIVGINTFGTFTPILMALAFRETKLFWGGLLFFFVIAIGCSVRNILDRLKLLFIPRLSIILTLIIAVMIILISVGYHTGFEVLSFISLFPIVIITMVIERFSITQMETGTKASFLLSLGTVIVACAGYLVISSEIVQLTMFFFPELLLAIFGILILIGRYTGLRLTELWRFRPLKKE